MARLARGRAVAASLAVAIAVVVTVVGGAWLLQRADLVAAASDAPQGGDRTGTGSGVSWRVLPDTFPVNSDWLSGPYLILPGTRGCFVGFGQDDTGTMLLAGYWRSTDGCSGAVAVSPTHRPVGDALPSYDRVIVLTAVPAHDGGFLAIGRRTFEGDRFAYESHALRVDPYHPDEQQRVRRLAEFRTDTPEESHIGPAALVATETGYVAVGRHDDHAVAWTSADGVTWHEARLPDAGLGEAPRVASLTAGPGGRLVAVGRGGTAGFSEVSAGWVSTDGGASWSQARMPETGQWPELSTVVYTGDEFVALGGEGDRGVRSPALVLTSPDGVDWTRDESLAAAGGPRVSAATVLPAGEVIAVSEDIEDDGEASPRQDQRCAAAWLRGADGWTREPIGCHGIPTGLTVLGDGAVAAVHWNTLYLRSAT